MGQPMILHKPEWPDGRCFVCAAVCQGRICASCRRGISVGQPRMLPTGVTYYPSLGAIVVLICLAFAALAGVILFMGWK